MELYLTSAPDPGKHGVRSLEPHLWKCWDTLMKALQVNRSLYSEARVWLISTIASLPPPPAKARLAAFLPLLQLSTTRQTASNSRHSSRSSSRGRRYSRSRSRSDSRRRRRSSRDSIRERDRDGYASDSSGARNARGRGRSRSTSRSRGKHRDHSKHKSRSRDRRSSRSTSRGRSRSTSHDGRTSALGRRAKRSPSNSQAHSRSRSPVGTTASGRIGHRADGSPSSRASPRAAARGDNPDASAQRQLLLLLCEQRPVQVASLLAERPEVFRRFFEGSDLGIMQWFSHFSIDGMSSFKFGAQALARYALQARDEAWQHLVRHWSRCMTDRLPLHLRQMCTTSSSDSSSSMTCAQQHWQLTCTCALMSPDYFCELNVLSTVHALVESCPGFWRSDPFLGSVTEGGAILQLDPEWFCQELLDILQEQGTRGRSSRDTSLASRTLQLIQGWLCEESWQLLVQRSAHLQSDEQLLHLVHTIGPSLPLMPGARATGGSSAGGEGRDRQTGGRHRDAERGSRGREHAPSTHADRQTEQGSAGETYQVASASEWRDMRGLIFGGAHRWQTVPQLVLTHALACCRSELLQALAQGGQESHAALREVCTVASQVHWASNQAQAHEALLQSLRPPSTSTSSKQLLGLTSWLLWLLLSGAHQLAQQPPPPADASGNGHAGDDGEQQQQQHRQGRDVDPEQHISRVAATLSSEAVKLLEETVTRMHGRIAVVAGGEGQQRADEQPAGGASTTPASAAVYDLLPSSDDEEEEGRGGGGGRRNHKSGSKRKHSTHKHRSKRSKRKKKRRRRSSSGSESASSDGGSEGERDSMGCERFIGAPSKQQSAAQEPLLLRVWLPHLQQPPPMRPHARDARVTPRRLGQAEIRPGLEFTATAQELPDVLVGYAVMAWLLRVRQQ